MNDLYRARLRPTAPLLFFNADSWGLTLAPNPLGRNHLEGYLGEDHANNAPDVLIQFEWRVSVSVYLARSGSLRRALNQLRGFSVPLIGDPDHGYHLYSGIVPLDYRGPAANRDPSHERGLYITREDKRRTRNRSDIAGVFMLDNEEHARLNTKILEWLEENIEL